MFELERLKNESGLSEDVLGSIEAGIREEFPDDHLLFELHLVRVLQAIKEGWITVDEVLHETVRA